MQPLRDRVSRATPASTPALYCRAARAWQVSGNPVLSAAPPMPRKAREPRLLRRFVPVRGESSNSL